MRELLDEAIGVAPPTRIDVDATIARQRRILLLRPAGVLVAAFATVAAIVVAGNGLAGPMRRTGHRRPHPGRACHRTRVHRPTRPNHRIRCCAGRAPRSTSCCAPDRPG